MVKEHYFNPVNIGFDIGIASVGWSVVDNRSGKIIETGVSIFPSGSASANEERRSFRQSRRLGRRRKNRINDMKKLLKEQGFDQRDMCNEVLSPYELRVRGLSEKLEEKELASVLLHLTKRRGISYDLGDLEEEGSKGSDYQASVTHNQKLLQEKTPGEIQWERLKKYGQVRGQVKDLYSENPETYLNVFPNSAYVDETEKILEKQAMYNPKITPAFIEDAKAIISRKREYYEGPGSEKSRTDYGIYRTDGTTLTNLFEILIGKDKIFPDEYRAAGSSYTAQLFNLLNDLNNLKNLNTEDGKITTDQKEAIISELRMTVKAVNMMKLISKMTDTEESKISGYRIDRKEKPEIHSLDVYLRIRKKFLEHDIDINQWEVMLLDELGKILTLNTENGEIRRALLELRAEYSVLTDDVIELILENKQLFTGNSNNKWHRFSLKTMNLLIPELLMTSKEQMTILTEMKLLHENKRDYSQKNKIDVKSLCAEIYNPIVRKSVKQAMDVFNALYQKYEDIAYLVVEMPRDDAENEIESKKRWQAFQKENEAEKDKALKEFQETAGVTDSQLDNQLYKRKKLRTKIRFWYQQEGICPYSGRMIPAIELFNQDYLFDIDHIIPVSISYDDSQNNKVLCYSEMNREKNQQTPYEFMRNGKGQGFDKLKVMVTANKRMSGSKKRNLLFTENLNDVEVRKRFIARNLIDTRYSSRIVLNELQQFVRSKKMDTKVTVIRGKLTSKLREKWRINKSRDTHHHHAIDACVIAVSPMLKIWERNAEIIPTKVDENVIDFKTGEILEDKIYFEEMFQLPYAKFLDQIPMLHKQIKFHHQVDKKMNRKVSDATIYSTRKVKLEKDKQEEDYVLGKIKDIYTVAGYKDFKKVYKDKTKFLMYHHDPQSFEKLEQIIKEYPDSFEEVQNNGSVKSIDVSPFEVYRRENGPVTKYAKKNNGPVIKSLKYYDKKKGSNIDITPKSAKNKQVILQSLKSWRTDVYFNHKNAEYEIMGIKYSDLCYQGTEYGIPLARYESIKEEEGVSKDSEFLMSLYRNDRVKVIDAEGNEIELLYASRVMPDVKGYAELKPLDRTQYIIQEIIGPYGKIAKNGRILKRFLPKGFKLLKVNTDILGNSFYIKKEGEYPKNILDNNI